MEFKSKLPEITLKYKTGETHKYKIKDSRTSYDLLKKLYDADTLEYSECAIVIFLNQANNTIGWIKLSQGGMSGTVVDMRMLLTTALQCGASSFIMSHNHPSGSLKPSQADINLTKKINTGAKSVDIQMLDHIIVTADGFYSFADEGLMH
jgi:DNA repair protein RadC